VGHLLYVSRRVREQQHFGNQLIDFSTPPVSHMWVRLSDFYTSIEQDKGLTLILPGEVKVDLANFDVKLQEIFLFTLFNNNKYLFLEKQLANLFFTSYTMSKNDVLTYILTI
jgi:hypothetical protein